MPLNDNNWINFSPEFASTLEQVSRSVMISSFRGLKYAICQHFHAIPIPE